MNIYVCILHKYMYINRYDKSWIQKAQESVKSIGVAARGVINDRINAKGVHESTSQFSNNYGNNGNNGNNAYSSSDSTYRSSPYSNSNQFAVASPALNSIQSRSNGYLSTSTVNSNSENLNSSINTSESPFPIPPFNNGIGNQNHTKKGAGRAAADGEYINIYI
jgi:hypothetical protein